MRYGVPYQGSKNSIAREIVEFLPAADTLIDICAGGCAITHASLELCQGFAPKWRHIISNDINPMPGRLFRDAIAGKYASETRWISREDFFALKDSDAYVKYCWSFANNGEQYMYSCEKEPWKRAVHFARVLGDRGPLREFGIDSDGSSRDIRAHADEYRQKYIRWMMEKQPHTAQKTVHIGKRFWEIQSLERLQSLTNLQSLGRLKSLENLHMLSQTVLSFEDCEIPRNAVVYADIPYEQTDCRAYKGFDNQKFYDWAARQRVPVFISSYEISDPQFVCVWEKAKRCLLQAGGGGAMRTERIYTQRGSIA